MTIALTPVLGALNIIKTEMLDSFLVVTMDDRTILYELQRFIAPAQKNGKGVPYLYAKQDQLGLNQGSENFILAYYAESTGLWSLYVPLEGIINRWTPERYLFMTPYEWREQNMEALKAAWTAGLTFKVNPPVEST